MAEHKGKIKVIDLFSGVGGLTYGFYYGIYRNRFVRNDNFEILFANDVDHDAATAFQYNYPNIKFFNNSIEEITENFLESNGVDFRQTDLVIGGPPCQSYSTVGRRKNDDRAKMYHEYKRLLIIIKPKMFIFENVLGILSFKLPDQSKIIDSIINEFNSIGYKVEMKVLNSVDYGVPQNRQRVFIVGIRNDTDIVWNFPLPIAGRRLTLFDAISDLPVIDQNQSADSYQIEPLTDYQRLMRVDSKLINDHYCGRYGERITSIIRNVLPGESHSDINLKVQNGILPTELYLSSGYRNSYGRLVWNKPSGTITNNFSTPSSIRCIHPVQNRALTIREAARIQSFPDWFSFYGTKLSKRMQVGNAVPPLLSIHLAQQIENVFRGNLNGE